MSEYIVQSSSLTAVANKIREKTDSSAPLEFPDEFIDGIDELIKIPETPNDSVLFYSLHPFAISKRDSIKSWDGIITYSTDRETWAEWDATTELSATIKNGFYRIYLKGQGNTIITGSTVSGCGFKILGSLVKCVGNFNNLLDSLGVKACALLFENCPTVDFDIELPFTTLSTQCYYYMFSGCSSLTKVPSLPAVNLTTSCYEGMFADCVSLQSAPGLPATVMLVSCYAMMFKGCSNLLSAPIFTINTTDTECCSAMFDKCVKMTTAPIVFGNITSGQCYRYMFRDCQSLQHAPDLPATVLSKYCYSEMFDGCNSLEAAPALPATTLADYCYQYMFRNTAIAGSPALPATTLTKYCYYHMFDSCKSLTSIAELPAITLAEYCYNAMYNTCSLLKLSTTQTGIYQTEYRIPSSGTGTTASNALMGMFNNTTGSFHSTPTINTSYYTSNTIVPAA